MGRMVFADWKEFMRYIHKVGPLRALIYVEMDRTVIMRPSVQSRIDSAVFVKATDAQLKELTGMVPAENVFTVAGFEWQEDRAG